MNDFTVEDHALGNTKAHMSGSGLEMPIPPVKRNRMRKNRSRKRSRMKVARRTRSK
ncbi:hypothetical protein OsI_06978 [Oryza sativa Indica Group]|jgi:hypothetical protein|uniref:Uncharacterized protein n=3 Tax=Oryza TaxID=4527 RepID=A0A0E0NDW6_ORYRU|nr:hypothetical protein OsI_06978 [Oryza sativa Indica Group]